MAIAGMIASSNGWQSGQLVLVIGRHDGNIDENNMSLCSSFEEGMGFVIVKWV